MPTVAKLIVELGIEDRLSPTLESVRSNLERFTQQATQAASSLDVSAAAAARYYAALNQLGAISHALTAGHTGLAAALQSQYNAIEQLTRATERYRAVETLSKTVGKTGAPLASAEDLQRADLAVLEARNALQRADAAVLEQEERLAAARARSAAETVNLAQNAQRLAEIDALLAAGDTRLAALQGQLVAAYRERNAATLAILQAEQSTVDMELRRQNAEANIQNIQRQITEVTQQRAAAEAQAQAQAGAFLGMQQRLLPVINAITAGRAQEALEELKLIGIEERLSAVQAALATREGQTADNLRLKAQLLAQLSAQMQATMQQTQQSTQREAEYQAAQARLAPVLDLVARGQLEKAQKTLNALAADERARQAADALANANERTAKTAFEAAQAAVNQARAQQEANAANQAVVISANNAASMMYLAGSGLSMAGMRLSQLTSLFTSGGGAVLAIGAGVLAAALAIHKLGEAAGAAKDLVLDLFGKFVEATEAAFRYNARIQQLQVSFEAWTGSAQLAREAVEGVVEFVTRTPFDLPGAVNLSRYLLTAGVAADQLIPTLRDLGDVMVVTGNMSDDSARRLGIALQQIATLGRLQGQEARQLTQVGIPIYKAVADAYQVSGEQARKWGEEGRISAEMVIYAIRRFADEKAPDALARSIEKPEMALKALHAIIERARAEALEPLTQVMDRVVIAAAKFVQSDAFVTHTQEIRRVVEAVVAGSFPAMERAFYMLQNTISGFDSTPFLNAARETSAALAVLSGEAVRGARAWLAFAGMFTAAWEAMGPTNFLDLGKKVSSFGEIFNNFGKMLDALNPKDRFEEWTTAADAARARFDAVIGRPLPPLPKPVVAGELERPPLGGLSEDDLKRVENSTRQFNRRMEDLDRERVDALSDYNEQVAEKNRTTLQRVGDLDREMLRSLSDHQSKRADTIRAAEDRIRALHEDARNDIQKIENDLVDRLVEIRSSYSARLSDFDQQRRDAHQRLLDTLENAELRHADAITTLQQRQAEARLELTERFAEDRAEAVEKADSTPLGRLQLRLELERLSLREGREQALLARKQQREAEALARTQDLELERARKIAAREEQQALEAIARNQRIEDEKTRYAIEQEKTRAQAAIAARKEAEAAAVAEERKTLAERLSAMDQDQARREEDYQRNRQRILDEAQLDITQIFRRMLARIEANDLARKRLLEDRQTESEKSTAEAPETSMRSITNDFIARLNRNETLVSELAGYLTTANVAAPLDQHERGSSGRPIYVKPTATASTAGTPMPGTTGITFDWSAIFGRTATEPEPAPTPVPTGTAVPTPVPVAAPSPAPVATEAPRPQQKVGSLTIQNLNVYGASGQSETKIAEEVTRQLSTLVDRFVQIGSTIDFGTGGSR